jgi:hypothetical protein
MAAMKIDLPAAFGCGTFVCWNKRLNQKRLCKRLCKRLYTNCKRYSKKYNDINVLAKWPNKRLASIDSSLNYLFWCKRLLPFLRVRAQTIWPFLPLGQEAERHQHQEAA